MKKINFSEVKGKDVVITIGPTGAGKSTIINVAVGCKVTFELDGDDDSNSDDDDDDSNSENDCGTRDWKATATPEIFPIGHLESCTFAPKFYSSK